MNKYKEIYKQGLKGFAIPENLIKVAQKKGYLVFDNNSKPFNINIWAVRSSVQEAGSFDDIQIVFWKNETGEWAYSQYDCTTDPSDLYLLNPINPHGTAIIKPGQYQGVWELGYHKGHSDHPALVQRRPITVIRDYNRDRTLDFLTPNLKDYDKTVNYVNASSYTTTYTHKLTGKKYIEDTGFFGINNHRAHRNIISRVIGNYSAGCVVQNNPHFYYGEYIPLLKQAIKNWGNVFTFTLITTEELINEASV